MSTLWFLGPRWSITFFPIHTVTDSTRRYSIMDPKNWTTE
jgi:hypothetical protein